ncbi:hypothetical protein ACU6U9_08335 [Pseudomonas sp. HK3]
MSALPKPNYKNPIHMLAFGLGSGLSPKAPGTMGTIAALPIYWFLLQDLTGAELCHRYVAYYGSGHLRLSSNLERS